MSCHSRTVASTLSCVDRIKTVVSELFWIFLVVSAMTHKENDEGQLVPPVPQSFHSNQLHKKVTVPSPPQPRASLLAHSGF